VQDVADRRPQGITILAVDDSASVRKLVELTLRREGYGFLSASTGLTALATLAEHRPDMILLDVMLDALDGFQLCRAIRRHPDFRETPIVILSGRESQADRETGFRAGVTDYLTKPFEPNELLQVVGRHTMPRSTGEAVMECQ
jgi:DNA-binding response OmpR family regulator